MIKECSRIMIVLFFIIFLFFYFFGSNIYQSELTTKRDLTIEQINKFEEDVKQGKEIDINDYVIKEKNYSNNITKLNDKISSIIESGFKKIFKYLLKSIEE